MGDHDLSGWSLMLGKADLGTRVDATGVATASDADFESASKARHPAAPERPKAYVVWNVLRQRRLLHHHR